MNNEEPNPYAAPMVDPTPLQPPLNAVTTKKPHRGVLVLVLGIVSLLICQFVGIVPWILANQDLKEMRSGVMDENGRVLTMVGKWLGIVSLALVILQMLAIALNWRY